MSEKSKILQNLTGLTTVNLNPIDGEEWSIDAPPLTVDGTSKIFSTKLSFELSDTISLICS